MSLQAELSRPASPVRRFFERRLPHIERPRAEWLRALYSSRTVRPPARTGRLDVATLSRAMTYRAGFGIAITPPARAIDGAITLMGAAVHEPGSAAQAAARTRTRGELMALFTSPAVARPPGVDPQRAGVIDFFHQLAWFLGQHVRPATFTAPCAPLAADVEERLIRSCVALAHLEAVAWDGREAAAAWLPTSGEQPAASTLLELAPAAELDDLLQLSQVFTSAGREQLLAHLGAVVVVAPHLVEDWAGGDLVCDGYLLSVTTTLRPRPLRPAWLYELLACALLDGSDALGIRGVGVYLTRQGRLITWDREQLVRELAPNGTAWADLRQDFVPAVRTVLGGEDELRRRWRFQP